MAQITTLLSNALPGPVRSFTAKGEFVSVGVSLTLGVQAVRELTLDTQAVRGITLGVQSLRELTLEE